MIFNKNKNMTIISVIKNEGPVDYLVWKNPIEDFNTKSQLIVSESEEALFCYEGVIQEIYTAGRYELTTANTPFIGKVRNSYSNGVSMFNSKVFYVNLSHALELKWGTDTPLQMRDAEFHFAVGVRAFGTYSVKVKNSKKFILKLLGSNIVSFEKEDIKQYFKTAFVMNIKNYLHKRMKEMNVTVLDMGSYMVEIANDMLEIMKPVFDEYGLELVHFYIKDISIPQDDPYYKQINEAYAKKASLRIQGQDFERQVGAEALLNASKNPGNMGANFGMGLAMGQFFGEMAPKMMKTDNYVDTQNKKQCPSCGTLNDNNMKFCSNCGNSLVVNKLNCLNCGFQLQENNKFCPNCGKVVEREKVCPNCQTKNPLESKFCGSCGAKLG